MRNKASKENEEESQKDSAIEEVTEDNPIRLTTSINSFVPPFFFKLEV